MDLSALAEPELGRAVSGLTEANVALTRSGLFGHLAAFMPGNSRYQFGFALCLQHFGETQLAGEYYSLAYALDPSDAACAFRLGECLVAAGHISDGQDALRAAIQLTELADSDPGIRLLAEQLLDRIN